jgi:2-C-methyl-D-erythritol 4-phosphate cytidylyltransferase
LINYPLVKEIIIAVNKFDIDQAKKIGLKYKSKKAIKIICGGKRRTDSVYNALSNVSEENDYILIHDAARPFITKKIIKNVLSEAGKYQAVICGLKVTSTIKKVTKNNFVSNTIDRSMLWEIQTPQVFKKALLMKAYEMIDSKKEFTDDASLVEGLGKRIKIVPASKQNIKITTPDDLLLAKRIIKTRK